MGPEPIDYSEPKATQLRRAGEGAIWYALRRAGWTDDQIHNSLRTHHAGILVEAAEWVSGSCRDALESAAADIRGTRTYVSED